MVRNRTTLGLFAIGLAIVLVQLSVPGLSARLMGPDPETEFANVAPPREAPDVTVIWRDFRPGERVTGPSTSDVRLCAAALERGRDKSALILRFCNSQPDSAQRRFAFGYDDLVVRARLPGNARLAYDLLDHVPATNGGAQFAERALSDNDVPIRGVRVRAVTDIVFVIDRELPVGLPIVEVTARYAGRDLTDERTFASLGPDDTRLEAQHAAAAPGWARAPY